MTYPPTLIVVDVQNGFVNARTQHVLPNILRLIRAWQVQQWPIVFSRFRNTENSGFEKWIGWTRLREAEETALHADIAPFAETIVDKTGYTVFTAEGRATMGIGSGDTAVICGIATDSCVVKTAADAFELDIEPVVAIDACATHGGDDAQNAGVLVMQRFIGQGQLVKTESVLMRYDMLDAPAPVSRGSQ